MNILIAGIVGVIMLLFGGAKYYNYRHYNPQDVAAALDQQRLRQQRVRDVDALDQPQTTQERVERVRIEMIQNFLNTLPSYDDYHLIETAYELNNLMTICPEKIDHCKIRLSQHFEEYIVRQLLEGRYTPDYINIIANNFIREPEDTND